MLLPDVESIAAWQAASPEQRLQLYYKNIEYRQYYLNKEVAHKHAEPNELAHFFAELHQIEPCKECLPRKGRDSCIVAPLQQEAFLLLFIVQRRDLAKEISHRRECADLIVSLSPWLQYSFLLALREDTRLNILQSADEAVWSKIIDTINNRHSDLEDIGMCIATEELLKTLPDTAQKCLDCEVAFEDGYLIHKVDDGSLFRCQECKYSAFAKGDFMFAIK